MVSSWCADLSGNPALRRAALGQRGVDMTQKYRADAAWKFVNRVLWAAALGAEVLGCGSGKETGIRNVRPDPTGYGAAPASGGSGGSGNQSNTGGSSAGSGGSPVAQGGSSPAGGSPPLLLDAGASDAPSVL